MSDRPNLLELHAREIGGLPNNWYWFNAEVKECPLGKYFEVTGAVAPLKTKGKWKGTPNWDKKDKSTIRTIQIGVDAHNQWIKEWEIKNNSCSECYGSGKMFKSWNVEKGVTYIPCKCGRTPLDQGQLELMVGG